MKVINNIPGLFDIVNGRPKTYRHGVVLEADSVLEKLAREGRRIDGIVAVTPVAEHPESIHHAKVRKTTEGPTIGPSYRDLQKELSPFVGVVGKTREELLDLKRQKDAGLLNTNHSSS